MFRAERQSARMSKITNDGLTRSGTSTRMEKWASSVKGLMVRENVATALLESVVIRVKSRLDE